MQMGDKFVQNWLVTNFTQRIPKDIDKKADVQFSKFK